MSDLSQQIRRLAEQFGEVATVATKPGRVIAIQPDLFGGPDVEGHAWVRPIDVLYLFGVPLIPDGSMKGDEQVMRQHIAMHADTLAAANDQRET